MCGDAAVPLRLAALLSAGRGIPDTAEISECAGGSPDPGWCAFRSFSTFSDSVDSRGAPENSVR